MIDGIRLKICGLTTLVDAECADRAGADALGFILYPRSPRHLSLLQYLSMSARLPEGRKRVAVMVEPSSAELEAAWDAVFDRFQIHFAPAMLAVAAVAAWSHTVGADRLWLAPNLHPGADTPTELPSFAGPFLIDTFKAEGFGGTGRTGDWEGFARQQAAHPDKTWVLAGGLDPDNIGAALAVSGAKFVDVNSGVETAPGVKDHEKIKRLVAALRRARTEKP